MPAALAGSKSGGVPLKTILTATAVAALLVSFAPVATSPAYADGITLKRGGSTSTRTSRNRSNEEPGEEATADSSDAGNSDSGDDVADAGGNEDSGSGWSWGGGRNDDDEPSVRDDDARETVVLSRDTTRHRSWWHRHRHGEGKRIWILNWW